MKKKIIISVLLVLLIGSTISSATYVKLDEFECSQNVTSSDIMDIPAGYMICDCDEIDCDTTESSARGSIYDVTIPDYTTELDLRFYATYKIINEKTDKEKWVFKMTLRNGGSDNSPVIYTESKNIFDRAGVPDDQEGEMEITTNINRDSFPKKTDSIKKFRVELKCEYYRGSWIGGEPGFISDDSDWNINTMDLQNEKPTIDYIKWDDVDNLDRNGGINKAYTLSVTASDPEGDTLKFYIDWSKGDVDESNDYIDSGSTFSKSHTWTETGDYEITVHVMDCFQRCSVFEHITFIAPRTRTFFKLMLFSNILERFPFIMALLNK
jgi:hypothetical protein